MTEFKEGDLVRAIPQLRDLVGANRPGILPGTEWHWQIGLVVEIEPQLPCSPTVVTALFPGSLVRRSAALFERVQDD